jgi:isoprenylcysteine carboxyl methyltransferase (ICMT) family protein YpbQ
MAVLLVVMRLLGRWWTVKLIIAADHELVVHALFRAVRHPTISSTSCRNGSASLSLCTPMGR